jgi:hypothetical protein
MDWQKTADIAMCALFVGFGIIFVEIIKMWIRERK